MATQRKIRQCGFVMVRGRAARRGVLLLIILSLLAMFAMVGLTFVLASNQQRRGAETAKKIDIRLDQPAKVLREAFGQVARGSTSPDPTMMVSYFPKSPAYAHNLLSNLYGNMTMVGQVTYASDISGTITTTTTSNSSTTANCQLVNLAISAPNNPNYSTSKLDVTNTQIGMRCVGNVLTVLNGPAAGISTRVVRYFQPKAGQTKGILQVVAEGQLNVLPMQQYINAEEPILVAVNGSPFSGLGYQNLGGNNPQTPWDDVTNGLNVDYTAVDYNNMALAMMLPARMLDQNGRDVLINGGVTVPIPSYHRPEWINFAVKQQLATKFTNQDKQKLGVQLFSLRPLGKSLASSPPQIWLHRTFTGSNPRFNPLWNGQYDPTTQGSPCPYQWDVDNDGDGVPDSVWVDLGFPARIMPDGRHYKPLFAVLCTDLGGRLNVNAHGCRDQALARHYQTATMPQNSFAYKNPSANLPPKFAGGASNLETARGQGYGPAEINLLPVLCAGATPTPDKTTLDRYVRVMSGTSAYAGRYNGYGEFNKNTSLAGRTGQFGILRNNRFFEYIKAGYWTQNVNSMDAYGSPPDFFGTAAIGLDQVGNPVYCDMGNATPSNWAYELNLDHRYAWGNDRNDKPFMPGELEAILRYYDGDQGSLPRRLVDLINDPTLVARVRNELTSECWDLPCPGIKDPKNPATRRQHLVELIGTTDPNIVAELLPLDSIRGLRMDLNRPFGNARLADGSVDAPITDATKLKYPSKWLLDSKGMAITPDPDFDLNNGEVPPTLPTKVGQTVKNPEEARQLYARHLYVLACIAVGNDKTKLAGGNLTEGARMLAQWAVNVVDFRDRDSIMTRFVYDPNVFIQGPSAGWNVSKTNPNPANVVWGCERPEVLFSETLASHDRRTEDTDKETTNTDPNLQEESGTKTTDDAKVKSPKVPDSTFDQLVKPEGSLFIELFHPGYPNDAPTRELFENNYGGWYLNLARTVPVAAGNQFADPVWRIVVAEYVEYTNPTTKTTQPVDPDDPTRQGLLNGRVDRSIYFNMPRQTYDLQGQLQFYPSTPNSAKMLNRRGGSYLMVGPGKSGNSGYGKDHITYFGPPKKGDTDVRRIKLTPMDNPTVNQLSLFSDGGTDQMVNYPAASVAVMDSCRRQGSGANPVPRFSVSEPVGGYPTPSGGGKDDFDLDQYASAYDTPLDVKNTVLSKPLIPPNPSAPETGADVGSVTIPRFRVLYLQRLANPNRSWVSASSANPNLPPNPYLTVDTMQVDLTKFNGISSDKGKNPAPPEVDMVSRERGFDFGFTYKADPRRLIREGVNIWKQELLSTKPPMATTQPGVVVTKLTSTKSVYKKEVQLSFGRLNGWYGSGFPKNDVNEGGPRYPAPWLVWNNRPFISQLELLEVPFCRSSQLLANYTLTPADQAASVPPAATTAQTHDHYGASGTTGTTNPNTPFLHLTNFFDQSTGLYRLLDLVHVPSRFEGTSMQFNPSQSAAGNRGNNLHQFHPPFNWLSSYREPGRINLNTVFSPRVWQGLMDFYPFYTPATDQRWSDNWSNSNAPLDKNRWYDFVRSRRDSSIKESTDLLELLKFNDNMATRIERPFRSSVTSIHETLLRQSPTQPKEPLFGQQGVLAPDPPTTVDPNNSMLPSTPTDPYRNSYFHYAGLQRLGNLTTSRSNVFAVWITVGYFEVKSYPGFDQNTSGITQANWFNYYPDGYELGPEMGSDTGETKRQRAFFIFDRSIPVGFIRGQDVNLEKAILLQRYLD